MKSLILKDFYVSVKYLRSFLLVIAVFIGMSAVGHERAVFFLAYPLLFATLTPLTLLAYDERSGWDDFSRAMPYSKAQLVSVKYVFALMMLGLCIVLTVLVQLARMVWLGSFDIPGLLNLLAMLTAAGLIVPSPMLPVMLRFGTTRGRLIYYILLGVIGGMTPLLIRSDLLTKVPGAFGWLALPVAAVIFALSWLISIRVYRVRL